MVSVRWLALKMLRTWLFTLCITTRSAAPAPFHANIPRVWDDAEVAHLDLPLAVADRSPRYVTAAQYYAFKVRPIYRSYPAYAKGREPAGYVEWLKEQEPQVIFDPAKLHSLADWITDKTAFKASVTKELMLRRLAAAHPGVFSRQCTSLLTLLVSLR